MSKQVLVVAAHPDDEVLGCGGTSAWHVARGDNVHVLIVAEGATSRGAERDTTADAAALSALQDAARGAASALGTEPPLFGGLPDNRLDTVPLLDVVKLVEATAEAVKPQIVYTHHAGDLNVDHQVVARAVATAFRPLPGASARTIYSFETVSSTEWAIGQSAASSVFQPTRFVDVSAHLDAKAAALECYAMEMRPFPHARSVEAIEALARVRGASVGLAAAEAFGVCREIAQ